MAHYVTDAGTVDCHMVRRSFDRFGMYEVLGHGGASITVKPAGGIGLVGIMYRFDLAVVRPWSRQKWSAVHHIRSWWDADDDELLALHSVAVREFNTHKLWDRCLFIEKALEFHGITEQMSAMASMPNTGSISDDTTIRTMEGIIAAGEATPYGKLLMAERDVFRPNGGQKDK